MTDIENWGNRMKIQGTAFAKFYISWITVHQTQKLKHLTKNDEISEYNLPSLRKSKRKRSIEDEISSEEENNFDLRMKGTKEEKAEDTISAKRSNKESKREMKVTSKKVLEEDDITKENTDIVTDINNNDWE